MYVQMLAVHGGFSQSWPCTDGCPKNGRAANNSVPYVFCVQARSGPVLVPYWPRIGPVLVPFWSRVGAAVYILLAVVLAARWVELIHKSVVETSLVLAT